MAPVPVFEMTRPEVEAVLVTLSEVEVAWLKKARVALATFAKKEVVVAFPPMMLPVFKEPRVVEPVETKFVEVPEVKVVPPAVFTEKIDEEAAFNIWKARPFAGEVWMVVVPWP